MIFYILLIFLPLYKISPEVGSMKPNSSIANVVLPLPLSPATVIIVGCSVSSLSETLFNAVVETLESNPRE